MVRSIIDHTFDPMEQIMWDILKKVQTQIVQDVKLELSKKEKILNTK